VEKNKKGSFFMKHRVHRYQASSKGARRLLRVCSELALSVLQVLDERLQCNASIHRVGLTSCGK